MNSKKKNHYFIGYMIRFDNELIKELNKANKVISKFKNVKIKNEVHNYHTRFIYLGYLDNETANNFRAP